VTKEQLKARWKMWENTCVKIGFQEKIQLKVVAIALGRSVSSISKRIQKLGLRNPTPLTGRVRGKKNGAPWCEKIPNDFAKMTEILHTYAPLKAFQKGQLALKSAQWGTAKPLPKGLTRGICIGYVRKEKIPFFLANPLAYTLSQDSPPQKAPKEKPIKAPHYVSLHYVEEWAVSKGFHYVKEGLRQRGFFYWKDGKHFSKAQLLIYINRIRLEKKLQPLVLYEEDNELYLECP